MADKFNEFSFSGSRYGKLKTCAYSYYLYYHEARAGWEYSSSSLKYKAWKLKRLHSPATWVGIFVHRWVRNYIIQYKNLSEDDSIDWTIFLESMEKDLQIHFNVSRRGCFNKDKFSVLDGHHFNNYDSQYESDIALDILKLLENFHVKIKPLLDTIDRKYILTIDVEDFSQFISINGVKVFTIVDFAYFKNKKFNIIDWKTGKWTNDDSDQLKLYAIYYLNKYKDQYDINYKNFSLQEFNLRKGLFYTTKLNSDEDFKNVIDDVSRQIIVVKETLIDVKDNIPKSEKYFQPTTDLTACDRCQFREICKYFS